MTHKESYKEKAFSLIELMIVIAIIGILAAIAVPSYLQYERRSRIGGLLTYAESFKSQVTEALMTGNSQAIGNLGNTFASSNDANVAYYSVGQCFGSPTPAMIITIFPTALVDPQQRQLGLVGTLNSDGSVSWQCGTDIPDAPESCSQPYENFESYLGCY